MVKKIKYVLLFFILHTCLTFLINFEFIFKELHYLSKIIELMNN